MLWQSTSTEFRHAARCLVRAIAALVFFVAAGTSGANKLELVLMPGPVTQAHAEFEEDCSNCHVSAHREEQPRLCGACHEDVAADIKAGTGYHGRNAEKPCRACHTEHEGRDAKIVVLDREAFNHSITDFSLIGKHAAVACDKCHSPGVQYRSAPHACKSCHEDDEVHRPSLGDDCGSCHDATGWLGAQFDHQSTGFELRLAHARTACTSCHESHQYKETPRQCAGCHAEEDVHHGALGKECSSCHVEDKWDVTVFENDHPGRFERRGAHEQVACVDCHEDMTFRQQPGVKCVDCHGGEDDVHAGALGPACDSCHVEDEWSRPLFDHEFQARFSLRGAHLDVMCEVCHTDMRFLSQPPLNCVGCHRKDDVHAGKLGERCETCHGQSRWASTHFDHQRDTDYPLRGGHAKAACESCHKDRSFTTAVPRTCVSCHRDDDARKGHRGKFGTKCQSCHSEQAWSKTRFNHSRRTGFPLRGSHKSTRCVDCHRGSLYKDKLSKDCVSCHRDDDVHKGELGVTCISCHQETRWNETTFDHSRTDFALKGAHSRVKCESCHEGGHFKEASHECVACHQDDDRHKNRLGPRCAQCHNPATWSDWRFDHDRQSDFKLKGAHRKVSCESCHREPVVGSVELPRNCIGCHRGDDAHLKSLGTRCGSCHVSEDWRAVTNLGRLWSESGGPPADAPLRE